MLKYIILTIISFLGLLAGSLIIFMASEEQKPGKRYFVFTQNVTMALIVALLLFFYNLDIILIIIIPLIVFILSYYIKNPKRSYALYPLIGIFFYIFFKNNNLLIILSILTFIYGLVTAFLLIDVKNKKSIIKLVLYHSSFLLTSLLPLLISYL